MSDYSPGWWDKAPWWGCIHICEGWWGSHWRFALPATPNSSPCCGRGYPLQNENYIKNKEVLPRERKRHTARRAASTRCAALSHSGRGGGSTYLDPGEGVTHSGWGGGEYLPWLGDIPTLAGGTCSGWGGGYLPWMGDTYPGWGFFPGQGRYPPGKEGRYPPPSSTGR